MRIFFALLMLAVLAGCRGVNEKVAKVLPAPSMPSNDRNWITAHRVMPYAKIGSKDVTVYNIRNFEYITERDVIPRYYDKRIKLEDVKTVDLIVTPFTPTSLLAHTMLSFGMSNGEHLAASVEARLEHGEVYSPIDGAAQQFELMYVLADERDVVRLRTDVRKNDVYVYRAEATPQQVQALFLDVIGRVNQLREDPEFYDTLTNNCTSNIVQHINKLKPDSIPYDARMLLTSLSPNVAYDLNLIERKGSFEETKRQAYVSERARLYRDAPDFSDRIRR